MNEISKIKKILSDETDIINDESNEIAKMKKILREGKSLTIQDNKATIYAIESPIGNAIYEDAVKNNKEDIIVEKKRAKWNDRIECKICGKDFIRSRRTNHNKTQYHLLHESMNQKIKELLLK